MLPPNLTQADFDRAMDELRAVLGREWVIAEDGPRRASYRDPFAPRDVDKSEPTAAVAPANVSEIQQVLTIARQYRLPLWPISTGRNFGYGGPAPRHAGTVVLDLKRMNRIIEVNEKHAYAVVEPGVSYFDLYRYLQARKIKLWMDPAAPGWGGVMGNLVDRGAGYTPYGEHFMAQCGMQVVLADGTIVETAMGATPNAKARHLYKYGHGAWVDGIFTQSNFGIVTQIGIWLMPEPPGYRPYLVTFPHEDDIHQITEVLRPLKLGMLVPNAATTVGLIWEAAVKVSRAQYYDGKGPLPDSARKRLASDLNIGNWNFYAALYGPEAIMNNNWKVIEESFRQVNGAKFYFEADRGGDPAFAYRAQLMRGIPNMTEYSLLNWVGAGSHVDFSPISPVTGDGALKQFHIMRDLCHRHGFDYIGEFLVGWRDMHHILMLVFERNDEERKRAVRELFEALVNEAAQAGYGEYRTHLDYMDAIAETYHWNERALYRSFEMMKDALDPQGILAPGKSGIWAGRSHHKRS
ncbi:MAG: FAD-binding oxidoreductase [Gammaproteobacteria bacterium]|nr:FAD-binding oxidoreductase [Gammaproteobacteria bacterium]